MPKRRVHGPGTYAHYVTFSCYKRRRLLNPDVCKRIVIGTLGSQLTRQNGICCGFVIMPDHRHAVVWFPEEEQISQCMDKWRVALIAPRAISVARQRDFNVAQKNSLAECAWTCTKGLCQ
ncbi:MAG: hypothetical protein NTW87_25065 [Planctomycetota bacterium]|nr:hypothetical protein [Planctomycetota bacterium]